MRSDRGHLAENRANRMKTLIVNPTFQPGQGLLRWSKFKDQEPGIMHQLVGEQVFPLLRRLGGDGSTYSEHMKDAQFTIPTPAPLSRVVDQIDDIASILNAVRNHALPDVVVA